MLSLIFPVLMGIHTFFIHSEALELGLFWLMVGNHFLLLPLFLIIIILSCFSRKIKDLESKIFYLPLVTWIFMLCCILIYFLMEQVKTKIVPHQEYIILSIVLILCAIYLYKSVRNKVGPKI